MMDPKDTVFYVSKVNELTKTYDGIDVCGLRLGQEIKTVIDLHRRRAEQLSSSSAPSPSSSRSHPPPFSPPNSPPSSPGFTRISIVAHSLGGLIARYALGVLFEPSKTGGKGTIHGLIPCHFISIATPHVGCSGWSGVAAQVPFIGWSPKPVQSVLAHLSTPVASMLFGRTGSHFFLKDDGSSSDDVERKKKKEENGMNSVIIESLSQHPTSINPLFSRGASSSSSSPALDSIPRPPPSHPSSPPSSPLPLLVALCHDYPFGFPPSTPLSHSTPLSPSIPPFPSTPSPSPAKPQYFLSALRAFYSRSAYANRNGDHLVGWANASLRFLHQLPV
eukprot:CAMPEP_0175046440 /NCGR_PEP_ID=MMETSP0052_2-20121109/5035_1 /TAXON_ID=51329 ORGANISM="Polytomella parva, Strain SAG 63-3" /NCGR_SAMPLE_ID=MMETSP0052_2 /ASSEMBLY_ACC=CAM_ASM_000194 /LENGTH=332 /DNA_ID=CAMNT_0016310193 /DNA_START=372 /DNA_END=1366 /DNA_ORIENTATION=+